MRTLSKFGRSMLTRTLVLLALLAAPSLLPRCNTSCRALATELCNTCGGDMDDAYGDAYCKCVEDGVLTSGDFSDEEAENRGIENDDDAQQWCDARNFGISNHGSDGDAACKADLQYLSQWGSDVCEEAVGWW